MWSITTVVITSHFSCSFTYCLIAYFYFIISCNLAWRYFLYYNIRLIHIRSRDPLYTPRRTQSPLFLCLYTHICAWHRQCKYSPYPHAVQRHEVESLAVVELLVELVHDLAVLASSPGPWSTTPSTPSYPQHLLGWSAQLTMGSYLQPSMTRCLAALPYSREIHVAPHQCRTWLQRLVPSLGLEPVPCPSIHNAVRAHVCICNTGQKWRLVYMYVILIHYLQESIVFMSLQNQNT